MSCLHLPGPSVVSCESPVTLRVGGLDFVMSAFVLTVILVDSIPFLLVPEEDTLEPELTFSPLRGGFSEASLWPEGPPTPVGTHSLLCSTLGQGGAPSFELWFDKDSQEEKEKKSSVNCLTTLKSPLPRYFICKIHHHQETEEFGFF